MKGQTQRVVRMKALAEHQRQASMALEDGGEFLSRSEKSFLHRVREQSDITAPQRRYLADLNLRVNWEMSLETR
ncbi:MAG: hypothetical protein KYX66_06825 [Blastomonas fulva]|uniref:hypothetical protein n=1 Tax=Blastomonas fulva TaxID=1550728 RepID=UPI0024E1BBC8|nr:hypothetical protein [Blastomonas fulva]MDK2756432.1 hypothetical protein [Blastomonas fulva]